jgi:hypothetical protein
MDRSNHRQWNLLVFPNVKDNRESEYGDHVVLIKIPSGRRRMC